jgi:hypothetical protein
MPDAADDFTVVCRAGNNACHRAEQTIEPSPARAVFSVFAGCSADDRWGYVLPFSSMGQPRRLDTAQLQTSSDRVVR